MTPVLIVGSGPVGLALANLLSDYGISFRLITSDVIPRPVWESRAEGVHGRTMDLFSRFGVLDQAFSAGRPAHGMSLHSRTETIARVSLDDPNSPYPGALILEQGKVEQLLEERLKSKGHLIERGKELIAVENAGCDVIAAVRSNGRSERIESTLLLACDGAHSAARKALGLNFAGAARPGMYALADVDLQWTGDRLNEDVHVFMSPLMILGRLASGTWKVASPAPPDLVEHAPAESVIAALQRTADEHGLRVRLCNARWTSMFRISNRKVDRMRHGNVFLVGDAAHIHSPMGGQGMNEGIQDALNLAWKVAWVLNGRAKANILDTYDEERGPLIDGVLRDTEQMTDAIELKQGWAREARDFGLRVAARLPRIEAMMREKFSGSTRRSGKSVLIVEHQMPLSEHLEVHLAGDLHPNPLDEFGFASAPRSGQRCPNVEIDESGATTRLYDFRTPQKMTLLVFVGKHSNAEQYEKLCQSIKPLEKRWGSLLSVFLIAKSPSRFEAVAGIADPDMKVHALFGARSECCYMVRPDDVIGFRSQPFDSEGIEQYLAASFIQ